MRISPDPILEIRGSKIGEAYPVYFIADIAANHDGDLSRAVDLIYKAADAGADAIKFQHFNAKTIVSDIGFKALGGQQSHQANWAKSVFDVYDEASVSLNWTSILKNACEDANVPFFTTPYALDIVELINDFVPAYKIGSGDITWIEMIEQIASKQKPYILASGASTTDEVLRAVSAGVAINPQLCLMQCNTNYTASLENFKFIQLRVLNVYRQMFPEIVLGLSDHTPGHATVLGAVALGARIIEKHFTDNVTRIGPDHKFSMDPSSWRSMVERTRELELALGTGIKVVEENEKETVVLQRRSLRATASFRMGHIISEGDFVPLRPCPEDAIPPFMLSTVLGKALRMDVSEGSYLNNGHII